MRCAALLFVLGLLVLSARRIAPPGSPARERAESTKPATVEVVLPLSDDDYARLKALPESSFRIETTRLQ